MQTELSLWRRLGPADIDLTVWPRSPSPKAVLANANIVDSRPSSRGRYVAASKNLPEGSVVLNESPTIKQLSQKNILSHCSECLVRVDPNSSHQCRRAKHCQWQLHFCSALCEIKHWTRVHRWLCRFPEFSTLGDEILLTICAFLQLQERGTPAKGIFGLVSNLKGHTDAQVQTYKDNTRLFEQTFNLPSYASRTLIIIQAQIRCNAFTIQRQTVEPVSSTPANPLQTHQICALGIGVYLNASLFNHACNPNAVALFPYSGGGDKLEIRSTHPIHAGEPISISYGPLAAKHDLDHRKRLLKEHYFFTCECGACAPIAGDTSSPECIYQCQHCTTGHMYKHQLLCPDCHQSIDWANIAKVESGVRQLLSSYQLKRALQQQQSIYHHRALPIGKTLDALAQTCASEHEFDLSASYCKRSLDIVRHVFGSHSIETAEEMLKLSSLLFHTRDHRHALAIINDTLSLYQTLGLDQQRPSDMDELLTMSAQLEYIARH